MSRSMFRLLSLLYFFLLHQQVLAQTTTSSTPGGSVSTTPSNSATLTPSPASSSSTPPDVYLNVPTLSVGRIELDVDDLRADINLNAQVASLVTLNAGVALSIQEVNLTISDIDAELELIVRLGHLVDIVNRVFESLDLNPLLISAINNVTSLLEPIVGAIDGLLGSITQGGTTLSFLIDNLGNIVQEVNGVSTIVGNYLTNMTDTGVSQTLSGGLIEKTYSYAPLNALVDIVFNAAGQVVQASVQKQSGSGGSTTTSSTSASSTTPAPFSSTSS
ncbi:uncharacterized protein A1O5_01175 [Cladophialophora psammophila CBS 110553]|uniref:Uncharacterized protein n=1 Tax=Cladophialophora psammophila CBS 110553 TaxID=1182543 RepID=W9X858_9EURO|nr:uncharacterized protein A1O5_01175 [Cladophialophora psammophila CBS 110553]EXJ76667.1 hypothetical protein A1O5_01175 [Cladophialophora psammophila CBS 110553]